MSITNTLWETEKCPLGNTNLNASTPNWTLARTPFIAIYDLTPRCSYSSFLKKILFLSNLYTQYGAWTHKPRSRVSHSTDWGPQEPPICSYSNKGPWLHFGSQVIKVNWESVASGPQNVWVFSFSQCPMTQANSHKSLWEKARRNHYTFKCHMLQGPSILEF